MAAPYGVALWIEDGKPPWCLIEDFEHFLSRWQKALARKRFFHVRYAGRDYWVNPMQIRLAEGRR